MDARKTVEAYRKAAGKLFGANKTEQCCYIVHPDDDTGGWAPNALAVIYLECDGRQPGDEYVIPTALDYWEPHGYDNCIRLSQEVGDGSYIEHINAAVAAVYEG